MQCELKLSTLSYPILLGHTSRLVILVVSWTGLGAVAESGLGQAPEGVEIGAGKNIVRYHSYVIKHNQNFLGPCWWPSTLSM